MLFIATVLLVYFGRGSSQEWVYSENGGIPANAFVAGTDDDGENLYVCKVFFKTETCVGKVNANLGNCLIPYLYEEHSRSTYFVLTVPPWEEYTLAWSSTEYESGNVPGNAVRVAFGIYVGRYNSNSYTIPGKIVQRHNAFFYGHKGQEYQPSSYEVLLKTTRSVDHYKLYNVVYDLTSVSYDLSPNQVTLSRKNVTNESPHDVTAVLSMDFTDFKTSEWSQTKSFEVHEGIKISVTAKIPHFGEASSEVELGSSQSSSYTQGGSYETSETTTHEITVNLPAYSNVVVSMIAKEGTGSIPYTGTLRVFFTNRQYYDQDNVEGIYTGVHYTSFDTSIKSSALKIEGNGGIKIVSAFSIWIGVLFYNLYINIFLPR